MKLNPLTSAEASEETTEESEQETEPEPSKSRLVTVIQGAIAFVVMFAVLWWLLSGNED